MARPNGKKPESAFTSEPIKNAGPSLAGDVTAELINGTTKENAIKAKSKYAVNLVFDGTYENEIRKRAKEKGLPVATYIKSLVISDINNE